MRRLVQILLLSLLALTSAVAMADNPKFTKKLRKQLDEGSTDALTLLDQRQVWRGRQVQARPLGLQPTGHAALDAETTRLRERLRAP